MINSREAEYMSQTNLSPAFFACDKSVGPNMSDCAVIRNSGITESKN